MDTISRIVGVELDTQLAKMRVVVTGGCGYIGSHVARAFTQHGAEVFVIDRERREHTLKHIKHFRHDDFASTGSLGLIRDYEPDYIVHCAGTSLVGPSVTDPGEYYDNNISKTIQMLNSLRDLPVKPTIMFSSSASVYGEPETVPIPETARLDPISPYGNTKYLTEVILGDYARAYGIASICFRYFNAAGAEPDAFDLGQEPNATHIVARVLEASMLNQQFTLNGDDYPTPDGSCIRDYVHVQDIAQAHICGAEYLETARPDPSCHIFNLGTNTGISNWEIVNFVKEKYGLPKFAVSERRAGDPAQLIADATRARETLQWVPEYSFLDTIVTTAHHWYLNSLTKH